MKRYVGQEVSITFDPKRCLHAAECVRGLPSVFDVRRRPWVTPDGASAEQVSEVVQRCPSVGLHFESAIVAPEEPLRPTLITARPQTVRSGFAGISRRRRRRASCARSSRVVSLRRDGGCAVLRRLRTVHRMALTSTQPCAPARRGRSGQVLAERPERRSGIAAVTRVRRPGGLSTSSRPSSTASRSASPTSPDPSGRAPPCPSSRTSTRSRPSSIPREDLGVPGRGVLGHVGQRLGHHEVGGRLDRHREPVDRHVDLDGNRRA